MALTITSTGNATSTAGSGTLDITGITASVGDVLLICFAADNTALGGGTRTVTAADNAGGSTNVYTQRGTTGVQTAGSANDGAACYFHECPVTTALSANTITLTFVEGNITTKAAEVYRLQPGTDQAVKFIAVDTASPGAARTTHSATTISVTTGHTIFAMAAIETDDAITGDGDTTNGNWSAVSTRLADGGADIACMSCSSQYKTVSATGNQAWACTTATGRDSVANTIIYAPVPVITAATGSFAFTGATASLQIGRMVVADAGSYTLTGADVDLLIEAAGITLDVDSGSFALTGTDASLQIGRMVSADAGSFTLTGTDAALAYGFSVAADAGSYALTGTDVSLQIGRLVEAEAGSYTLTGSDAELEYVAGGVETSSGVSRLARAKSWPRIEREIRPDLNAPPEAEEPKPAVAATQKPADEPDEIVALAASLEAEAALAARLTALEGEIARRAAEQAEEDDLMIILLLAA
jgi:hypothetical protein